SCVLYSRLLFSTFPYTTLFRSPWIIIHFKHESLHLIFFHQFFFPLFRIRIHGAEFIDTELSSIFSYSFLREKDRAGTLYIDNGRSEEHTSELQSRFDLVCRLLL